LDRLRAIGLICLGLLAAAACGNGGGTGTPTRVIDSVRVSRVHLPARGAIGRCIEETTFRRGSVVVVERVGRITRSLTITQRGSPDVFACDATGVRLEGREWCGVSAGRLRHGRVSDPRLELLCRDRRGRHVASAFVNPRGAARWIAVAQHGFSELYPTAAGLPVRIASTAGVDYDHARATFRITQLDAGGRVLERARIVARVAG
jgi:hypothetical protein